MLSVATLVSPPALAALDDRTLQNVARSIPGVEQTAWLDAGIAADIFFDAPASAGLLSALRADLQRHASMSSCSPSPTGAKNSSSPIWTRTMIEQECLDELADFAGLRDHVAPITARACAGKLLSNRRCASGSRSWKASALA